MVIKLHDTINFSKTRAIHHLSTLYHTLLLPFMLLTWTSLNASAEPFATLSPTRDIVFELHSKAPIVTAYGLVLHGPTSDVDISDAIIEDEQQMAKPSAEMRPVHIEPTGKNTWRITVILKPNDYLNDSLVSVIANTKSGSILTTEVKMTKKPLPQSVKPTKCIFVTSNDEHKKLASLDKESLSVLLNIRVTKETILEKDLEKILQPEMIDQLSAIEAKLGLVYPSSISISMPLEELAFRLASIELMLASR